MEAVLDRSFISNYSETRKDIYNELKSRIDNVILNSMKGYLRENGIQFDGSSIDLEEFKKTTVKGLDKQVQVNLANIEKQLNTELNTVVEELKDGSQNAFGKFAEKIGGFGKSATAMIARATAIKTAYLMSPTVGTAALGTTIMAPVVYNTVKDLKDNAQENTRTALDIMLVKLATVKVGDRQKFDISQSVMDSVYDNLRHEGVTINKDDPTLFLRDVTRLDNSKKEKAVNIMNNLMGNVYNVDEELKQAKVNLKSIKDTIGKDVVAPISTAALYGMSVGGALNDIAPDLLPSTITALSLGAATGNATLAITGGSAQLATSKFASGIPWLGNMIEKINSTETLAASTGAAVTGVVLAKVVPTLAYKGAKGVYNKIKRLKASKESKQTLEEAVANKLRDEEEKVSEAMSAKTDRDAILDVIKDVFRERGEEVPQNIDNIETLKQYIKGLDGASKREVYKVASILEDIKEKNTKSLKTTLKSVAKTAYWGGVIALAGLGAYDSFINPGFLDGLHQRDELDKEIAEIKSRDPDVDIKEARQELIDSKREIMQKKYDKSIDEVREFLPESHDELDNVVSDMTRWHVDIRDANANKKIFANLGFGTPEGIKEYLSTIDPTDENLKTILDTVGVDTVEQLANDPCFQYSVNTISRTNYYYPKQEFSWLDLVNPFSKYSKYVHSGSEHVEDALRDMINSSFKDALQGIPLSDATPEVIEKYVKTISKNPDKMKMFSKYLAIKGIKDEDYFSGLIKNAGLEWGIVKEDGKIENEAKKFVNNAKDVINDYNAGMEKLDNMEKMANSSVSSNPYVYVGTGAAIGAGIGATGAVTKNRKSIFAKMKSFITDKVFSDRKQKRLPPAVVEEKIDKPVYKREKMDVRVDEKDLKPLKSSPVKQSDDKER